MYEVVLTHELKKHGLNVERQAPISIEYDGIKFDEGFRADIIIESKVILELKSVNKLESIHDAQLLTYLKLADLKLGILINFNVPVLKDGIKRIVNNL